MLQDLKKIKEDFFAQISQISNYQDLENLRIEFLGKKSSINLFLQNLRNLSNEERKEVGAVLNQIKTQITQIIQGKREDLELLELNQKLVEETIDLTQPIRQENQGLIHPISKAMLEIEQIFAKMGFQIF